MRNVFKTILLVGLLTAGFQANSADFTDLLDNEDVIHNGYTIKIKEGVAEGKYLENKSLGALKSASLPEVPYYYADFVHDKADDLHSLYVVKGTGPARRFVAYNLDGSQVNNMVDCVFEGKNGKTANCISVDDVLCKRVNKRVMGKVNSSFGGLEKLKEQKAIPLSIRELLPIRTDVKVAKRNDLVKTANANNVYIKKAQRRIQRVASFARGNLGLSVDFDDLAPLNQAANGEIDSSEFVALIERIQSDCKKIAYRPSNLQRPVKQEFSSPKGGHK